MQLLHRPNAAHLHSQGAAGHLCLASGAQGQDSSVQVIQGGLPGSLHYSLYKRCKHKSKRPFMHEHIRQKKHETVLISQGELHVQKSSLILRINHNSAEAITKPLSVWLSRLHRETFGMASNSTSHCTYAGLHIYSRVTTYTLSPLSHFALEWGKINNYSRTVALVSMQRQTTVLNGVMEPLFLCVRQSRE